VRTEEDRRFAEWNTGSVTNAPEDASVVEAIDRALRLLDVLGGVGGNAMTLGDLAERTGMHKSTAYRALCTMRARGYVAQDPVTGGYCMGAAAMALGRQAWPDYLIRALHPALTALSREAGELTHLGQQLGDRVIYLDKVETDRPIRVWSSIGVTVPLVTTGMGRAILAFTDVGPRDIEIYCRPAPGRAAMTPDLLQEVLETTRRVGYAVEREVNEPGIACLGVPLLREGRAVAAISITTFAQTFDVPREAALADAAARVLPPLLPDGLELPPALLQRIA